MSALRANLDPLPGAPRRRGAEPDLPRGRLRAAQGPAAGHPAAGGGAARHGGPADPAPAPLRRGARLRDPAHRLRHDGVGGEADPRRRRRGGTRPGSGPTTPRWWWWGTPRRRRSSRGWSGCSAGWRRRRCRGRTSRRSRRPPAPRVYLLDRPGSIQTVVIAGQLAPPRANPQEIAQTRHEHRARRRLHLPPQHEPARGRSTGRTARAPRSSTRAGHGRSSPSRRCRPTRPRRPCSRAAEGAARHPRRPGPHGRRGRHGARRRSRWRSRAAGRPRARWCASIAQIVRFGFDDRYFDAYPGKVPALAAKDLARAAELLDPGPAHLGDRRRSGQHRARPARARSSGRSGGGRGREREEARVGGEVRALSRPRASPGRWPGRAARSRASPR